MTKTSTRLQSGKVVERVYATVGDEFVLPACHAVFRYVVSRIAGQGH